MLIAGNDVRLHPFARRSRIFAVRAGLAAGIVLLAAFAGAAAHASPAADVEKSLSGLASWSADFAQTIDDGRGHVLRSAAGRLYLQRPGKFRWDYTQPSEQLVLADGKQVWFYDKDLAQANVRDMDTSLASTPASLLSGSGSVGTQFDVTALPPSGDSRGINSFRNMPTPIFSWCGSASTRTANWHRCSSPTSSIK